MVCIAAPIVGGCGAGAARPAAAPGASGGPGAAPVAESFRPASPKLPAAMQLFLPGSSSLALVQYEVVDGMAVMEGDIMLGPSGHLPFRYGLPWASSSDAKSAVATNDRSHLWPRAEIPFVIDGTVGPQARDYIQWAIAHLSTTELRLRPRTVADRDYVVFNASGSGCSSYLGRIGGPQEVQVADCGRGSVVHELLHAAGFYHEQSRGDRDQFVTIHWNEISPGYRSAFEKRDNNGQDIGSYDYGSIMHYPRDGFSMTGRPTISTTVPGVTIGQRDGLSAQDRAAITFLYGGGALPTWPSWPPGIPPYIPLPQPQQPQQPQQPPAGGSWAGAYSSARGDVGCMQSGVTVSCNYPGGAMLCVARGAQLDCGWAGGGQGLATFQRQPGGAVSGMYGDFLSTNSRGGWDLVPAGANPAAASQPSLSGEYASTRGPMTCSESATSLACNFVEQGSSGRLDCQKGAGALSLDCTWVTFFPRIGAGRAAFTRRSAAERSFTGTWGMLVSPSGAGAWEMTGR